ncbi:coatomer subunit alpha-1-like [Salvia splendens]|uniref:coatomer subunit alpha-1-like n=1 Tax=Salvia splendens TaxID=180675 RepID=UPI001C256770|nr:coatomer subunit alpha-1-like [Salvia splendens]
MLVKFEIKSNRVKGLCFHSWRPWILASMTTGVIQLWDHFMGILIGDFRQHRGPVRSVHFHTSQPLFVSGGDDFKIKVWNYELHQCLFTLLGHHDYIRTVQFHHEAPWILSASDDQTIRIWNWQSRTCISVLNGHSHYVMCASFNPKEDIVVSASLDQTIRVWDIGALRKKSTVSPADDILELSQMNPDFFGGVDAVVKYVLEGHNRGVTWVSFHPTLPWIVSCADDRQVKVWHMEDKKVILTLKGHMNNVSCVLFHARQNVIVSNSEDKSIRVWDATNGTALQIYKKKHDKFWILAGHPEMNLLAAGHDSGMIVYKLKRERPAFSVSANALVYVKGRFLCVFEYSTQKDTQLIPIRQPDFNKLNQAPRILSYSPAENAVLVCSDTDGGSYELYIIPQDSYGRGDAVQDAKKGTGGSAVFIARNRFAVLERSTNKVLIKNLTNDVVNKSVLPVATNAIFYAGKGNLLCRSENEVVIFDPQQMIVLGDLQTSFVVRYVVWSPDMKSVALLGLHTIVLADKNLVQRCNRHETIRVKSGAWDDNGVFIYTTLTHIKYCLPNGESGIIKTLDVPVYVTKIYGSTIFCLDRDGISRPIIIDSTEYIFKLSLLRKRYDQVMSMIMNSELCGQAMIAYLKKGFPQAALHFERSRCNLALKSGNIEKALELGKKINEKDYWYRLGVDSLWQGNAGIVEYAYQKTRNFERLSFHYLITGNLKKLSKMMKIAEVKNEVMGQFHDALYLGDVQERVKILENAGHLPLAYVTASLHGLHDIAERLASNLGENLPSLPEGKKASLLIPPSPVLCAGDWPLLRVSEDIFEGGLDEAGRGVDEDYEEAVDVDYEEPFDADLGEALNTGEVDGMENEGIAVVAEEAVKHEGNDKVGGWDHEDLDLPPEMPEADSNACSSVFVAPSPGMPVIQIWVQRSSLAAEHAAAGNFEIAMRLLYRQLGIRNFSPLRTQFIDLHMGSHTYLPDCTSAPVASAALERGESASPNVGGHPALSSNSSRLDENATGGYMATTGHLGIRNIQPWGTQFTDPHMGSHTHLPDYASAPGASVASPNVGGHPALSTKFSRLDEKVTDGYMATTDGKFSDALGYFMSIMHTIPLIVVERMEEVEKVKELVITIKEYVLGFKMELKRRELKDDPVRQQELAAYLTHCNLQPLHTRLALLNAMSVCYKAQNLRSAANFAQRLLETEPSDEYQDRMARQVVQAAAARSMHDATQLNYDFRSPFVVCGATFVPIYRGQKYVTCPYCTAQFVPSQQGQICAVCELAEIGSEGSGLMCSHSQIT